MDEQQANGREQHEVADQYREMSPMDLEAAGIAGKLGTTFEVAVALVTIGALKERGLHAGRQGRELRNAAHMAGVRTRRALQRGGVQTSQEEVEAWVERVVALVAPAEETKAAHEQLLAELEAFCVEQ